MIEVLDQSTGNVFAMRLSGKLLHRDYQQFVPMLENRIKEYGSVRCFIEMTEFQGIELRALWDEIKIGVQHARQIERCAVVGDRAWERWMTNLSRAIFSHAETRFYDIAERDKAWDWINEGL
jgi:universal stress protein A